MRFLLTALLVVWFFWRLQRLVAVLKKSGESSPSATRFGHRRTVAETLERCANCGVHLPTRQALPLADGSFACSAACHKALTSA